MFLSTKSKDKSTLALLVPKLAAQLHAVTVSFPEQ